MEKTLGGEILIMIRVRRLKRVRRWCVYHRFFETPSFSGEIIYFCCWVCGKKYERKKKDEKGLEDKS